MRSQIWLITPFFLLLGFSALASSSSKEVKKITLPEQQRTALKHSEPALITAVARGEAETVRSLLQAKVDVNELDEDGGTALLYAVSGADLELVKLLVENGSDISILYSKKKENILFEASRIGSLEIVNLLVALKKSAVNDMNLDGETPIFEAARFGHSEVAKALIAAGAKKNLKNKLGKSPYDLARERKLHKTAEILK